MDETRDEEVPEFAGFDGVRLHYELEGSARPSCCCTASRSTRVSGSARVWRRPWSRSAARLSCSTGAVRDARRSYTSGSVWGSHACTRTLKRTHRTLGGSRSSAGPSGRAAPKYLSWSMSSPSPVR